MSEQYASSSARMSWLLSLLGDGFAVSYTGAGIIWVECGAFNTVVARLNSQPFTDPNPRREA